MIFGQVITFFIVNPDPNPHFRFHCEHGARGDAYKSSSQNQVIGKQRQSFVLCREERAISFLLDFIKQMTSFADDSNLINTAI